jgi:hypothetical protein
MEFLVLAESTQLAMLRAACLCARMLSLFPRQGELSPRVAEDPAKNG